MADPQGIYLEYKPAGPLFQHLYLVYRDGAGGEFTIRGGPTDPLNPIAGDITVFGNVPLASTKDRYGTGESAATRGAFLLLGGPAGFTVWENMVFDANIIHNAHISYDFIQTSNSVNTSLLAHSGFDVSALLKSIGLDFWQVPGATNLLPNLFPSNQFQQNQIQPLLNNNWSPLGLPPPAGYNEFAFLEDWSFADSYSAPPGTPNNPYLTVQTNTSPTVIQGGGSTDFDGTADNVSQGILISNGTETVSMNPADVNQGSTGDADALAASNIVTDGFRPGNFNVTGSWFDPLSGVVDAVGGFFDGVGQTITAAYTNVANFLTNLWSYIDPVLLDLNGDGVKLTNYTEKPVLFDIDHDGGSLEVTGWVTPQDGIVVHDLNSNGVIDNMSETLSEYYNGTVGTGGNAGTKPFANGFAALKSLDSNNDNVFNSSDASWNNLRVWVDANSDGKTDAGELKTFAQLGITEINLANTAQSGEVRDGNEVLSRGTFVQSGQTKEAIAARFVANPNGSTFTPSGTGTMVTTQGNVTSYASNSATGETIDVAAKAVMNAYGAQGNDTLIGDANDNWLAGGVGSDMFNAGAGDDVLLIDASDLPANIHAGAGRDIVHVIGDGGVTLNLAQAEVEIVEGGRGGDVFIGGGLSNVFVRGGAGNDIIIGGAANDALSGEEGDDFIYGEGGNDLIRGHQGRDLLSGSLGDDIIEGGQDEDQLNGGDGNDVLQGDQDNDRIEGGAGIDVAKYRGSYADYRMTYATNGVWVSDRRSGRDGTDFLTGVERLSFADVTRISIDVPAPLPVNDVVMLPGPGAYLIPKATLLANDLDYQGDAISIASVIDAVGGTAVLQGSGDVIFTPDPNYLGLSGFAYRIRDSQNNPGVTWTQGSTGQAAEAKAVVTLRTQDQPTDPLFTEQWYLSAANVLPVWKDYTGKGVTIGQFEPNGNYAVHKEIFDYRHPDLAPNVNQEFLASGEAETNFSTHATLVAGVMVAARNDEGIVGVAYDAQLAGHAAGDGGQQLPDWNVFYKMKDYDIANNSWGIGSNFAANHLLPGIDIEETFIDAISNGRQGLGTVIVFAASNDRAQGGNTNYSNLTNSRFSLTVGAINAPGDLGTLVLPETQFSAPGASVLIAAPGSNMTSASSLMMNDNGSVFGADAETVKGTSFSTPVVSGIVALMLEANPGLGYRDVQEILAMTAKKVDPTGSAWAFNSATNWNGGGMHVSYDYGFGAVDAKAAVRLAETWQRQSTNGNPNTGYGNEAALDSGVLTSNQAIPDGSGVLTKTVVMPSGERVEHVEVIIELDHQRLGDLVVALVSPTGTESVLMNRPGKDPNDPLDLGDTTSGTLRYVFGSTRDWGESSGGTWTLKVEDKVSGPGSVGTLNFWDLRLFGKTDLGEDTYVYTNEYDGLATGSRALLSDTGGMDVLNAAAVDGNTTINLQNRTATIDGAALTIAAGTVIEQAFTGDGNDTLTGDANGNRLAAGRGADVVSGGAGQDIVEGGSGNDTLTGGTETDVFVIHKDSNAADTITDFNLAGNERIGLVGFGTLDFGGLTLSQEGANARVTLGFGQSVLLQNVTASSLTADTFKFFDRFDFARQYTGTNASDPTIQFGTITTLPGLYMAGGGDDLVYGSYGRDTLYGGAGNDTLVGEVFPTEPDGTSDTIYGEDGDDEIYGGVGDDILFGGAGVDTIQGNDGNDTIYLEGDEYDVVSGLNYVYGMAGSDRFVLTLDSSPIAGTGSFKNLIYQFTLSDPNEKVDLTQITSITSFGQLLLESIVIDGVSSTRVRMGNPTAQYVTLYDITPSSLGANNFIFYQPTLTQGTPEADTLTGDAGGNVLDGGLGADTMTGRTGDDSYIVDNVGDVVNELPGGGFDTMQASVPRTLEPDLENLALTGTASINGTGNAQNNRLTGNSGDNILDGGSGADTLIGGLGNDTYIVDHGSDSILEQAGGGTDFVQSSVSFTLGSEIENLTLTGTDNIDATGNALANVLTGNAGDNFLDGAGGADTLVGGAGNDTYLIDSADTVTEQNNEGIDTIYAGFNHSLGNYIENLILIPGATTGTGNELDNVITGNAANNTLTGNGGNDALDGRTGNDTLIGGTGDDTYILDNVGDSITETAGNGIDTVVAGFSKNLTGTELENLILTGTGDFTGTGNAFDNRLVGNSGANILIGNQGNDYLDGGSGADTLSGGAGDDTYIIDHGSDTVSESGGNGTDTVVSSITHTLFTDFEHLTLSGFGVINGTGNASSNVLIGNSNANTLTGLDGNDRLDGGGGADSLLGGIGNDTYVVDNTGDMVTELANQGIDTIESFITKSLATQPDVEHLTLLGTAAINATGNSLNNNLIGNSGNNVLDGGAGADSLVGGAGGDTYWIDDLNDTVTELAGNGTDTLNTSITRELSGQFGNIEHLTLVGFNAINGTGNSGNNMLIGNSSANTLTGLDGHDRLDGGAGADTLLGGIGNDIYVVSQAGDTVIENANEGTDTVETTLPQYTLPTNVENLVLLSNGYFDEGTGNALNNVITGNSGFDWLHGGAGNDTLFGEADGDALFGDAGADVLNGGDGDDGLTIDAADTSINGGAGYDVVYVDSNSTAGVTLNLGTANVEKAYGGVGDDTFFTNETSRITVYAGNGNDTLIGSAGADVLEGDDGADSLSGGAGADVLQGGAGGDIFYADAEDTIDGGTGNDVVDVIYNNTGITVNMTTTSIEYAYGSSFADTFNGAGTTGGLYMEGRGGVDTLTGGNGNDSIYGGTGNDVMSGGLGNDVYRVEDAGDVVIENADEGTDAIVSDIDRVLVANVENLWLNEGSAISGTGNSLNNTLTGNSNNNLLEGKGGNDTLIGSAGNDTYVFSRTDGQDTIQDSSGTSDTVQFTTSINPLDLILERNVNDLRISLYNSTDRVTIQNWYGGTTNQTETIQAGNAQQLLNTQVDQLIQAMASFSTQTGLTWEQGLAQQPQNVQAVLAASWQ